MNTTQIGIPRDAQPPHPSPLPRRRGRGDKASSPRHVWSPSHQPNPLQSHLAQPRRGLTLVEVIAGLALMASLLATMVVAYSAHLRQHRNAQRKVLAVELLDRQLEEWRRASVPIPVPSAGEFLDKPEFHWQTELVPNATLAQFHSEVVRIEVREKQPPQRLLCSLELPRPKPVTRGSP